MITGKVTNLRPHVDLFVHGEGGQGNVEFTLDTGFTAELTLPLKACIALKLPLMRERRSFLADGSEVSLEVYMITLNWDGEEREAEVLALDSEPLLGMTMLKGYDVFMSVEEGGTVRIQKSLFKPAIG
jgi:clan AA aspartic protease